MVDMKVETTESDPSATSIGNDQTVNSEGATVPGQIIGKSDEIEGAKTGDEEIHEQGSGEINVQEKPDTGADTTKTDGPKPEDIEATTDAKDTSSGVSKGDEKATQSVSTTQGENTANGDAKPVEGKGRSQTRRSDATKTRGTNQGRRGKPNFNKNVKTDFTSQKETDDPNEIRKQVEFYFSDSNLPFDEFLLEKVGGSQNKPVKISVVHNFKRMRHFQPYSAVVAALRESTFLEVTDDEEVRRKVPLEEVKREEVPKVYTDKTMGRSIYAKGFGGETPSTQFDIEAFFAPYGPTNAVRLRRTPQKQFKSSVFVEFDSESTQKAFLALETKPKWKGEALLIKSKYDYVRDKEEDVKAGRLKPTNPWPTKGASDNRDWKTRRDEDQKNGFRNGRGRGGHGRGRGGGGRGGRGGGRDRNREREQNGEENEKSNRATSGDPDAVTLKTESVDEVKPAPATSASDSTSPAISAESKKRVREDDGGEDEGPIKKIDSKTEISDGADKKRAREDDDGADGQGSSKKADLKTEPS